MSKNITTNHRWRAFSYRYEVPPAILASEFDWLSEDDGFDGFIKYRGRWYHVSGFMNMGDNIHPEMCQWQGYHADSYFSGIVINVSPDGENYQIGTYIY